MNGRDVRAPAVEPAVEPVVEPAVEPVVEPAVEPVVERYLAEITARLPGSPRAHSGIVDELRSGLLDATDAHYSAGLAPAQAAQAAIGEFGDPVQVANGFMAEIVAVQARRTAVVLLASGPLVGLLWIATAATSRLGSQSGTLWQWAGLPPVLRVGVQLVAVAVLVTAWASILGIVTAGRLSRWLPVRPRRTPAAAAVAAFGAVGADGLGLLLLAAELSTRLGDVSLVPAAVAAAASLARLLIAQRAARHYLAVRRRLT